MANWAQGFFITALIALGITSIAWVVSIFYRRLLRFSVMAMLLGWLFLTLSIVLRIALTGRGPFSNMYEFTLAFAWGILAIGALFWWRSKVSLIAGITTMLALGFLIFAVTLSSRVISLVPALQQSTLLSLHVTAAAFAYGAFSVSFGTAIVYLLLQHKTDSGSPKTEVLDRISYQAVIVGFPLMTLTIILGAIWAEISWGRYWGWDPKETASLVTWLIYAAYLHTRVLRGWRGKKSAVLLIVGFCAVLFTFFGNYIFQGLHSYR
jgi:cytochrome c-type biogenesis protein CcsB